jgi:hypothetical protein
MQLANHFNAKTFKEYKLEAEHWLVESTAVMVEKGLCPGCWLRLIEQSASAMADKHDGGRQDDERLN